MEPDEILILPLGAHIQRWLTTVAPDWQFNRQTLYTATTCLSEYINMASVFMSVDAAETISALEDGIVYLSMPTLQALNNGNDLNSLDDTTKYLWKTSFLDVAMGLYLQLQYHQVFYTYDHIRVVQLGSSSVSVACYLHPPELY